MDRTGHGPRRRWLMLLLAASLVAGGIGETDSAAASGASRIRDLARIQGVRDNQLVGYGLVVGLDGTGDKSGTGFTLRSVARAASAKSLNTPTSGAARDAGSCRVCAHCCELRDRWK